MRQGLVRPRAIAVALTALLLLGGTYALRHPGPALGSATNRSLVYQAAQSVEITRYSPVVSGNEGAAPSGTTSVTVALLRAPDAGSPAREIARATGPVSGTDGSWSVTLVPDATTPATRTHAPAFRGDTVTVHYTGPADAAADQSVALGAHGDSGLTVLDGLDQTTSVAADGGSGHVGSPDQQCDDVGFVVNGAAVPTTGCNANFTSPVTDGDHVQVLATEPVASYGSGPGSFTVIEDAPLPGTGGAAPTCSAEYVTAVVTCSGLNGKTFSVTRARGSQTVTLTGDADPFAAATMPGGFVAGDTVTLREQGVTRVLSTLTLDTLRVDSSDATGADGRPLGAIVPSASGGNCTPNKLLALNALSSGVLCNLDGTQRGESSSVDDTSGGLTSVSDPLFAYVSPQNNESIGGTFTAYTDSLASATATLTIHRRNPDGSLGAQVGSPIDVDPANGGNVSGLATGRYLGLWKLTDPHGDTNTIETQFIVQPSGAQGSPGTNGTNGNNGTNGRPGATGPAGPRGPRGPRGPAGASAPQLRAVVCTSKEGKHGDRVRCRLVFRKTAKARLIVALSHGRATFAATSSTLNGRRVNVALRSRRTLRRGAVYTLTLIYAAGGKHHRTAMRFRLR